MVFGTHFYDFGSLLGSLLETIFVTFWVPFLHRFLDPPKTSKKGGGPLAVLSPSYVCWTLSPPSSDSSPLVKPLRVLPERHRTHWASQSFPEQQTSVLSQQKTSILSQQKTRRLLAAGQQLLGFLFRKALACPVRAVRRR